MQRPGPGSVAGPSKTPIQVLHEYGIRTGNLPVYTLESAEGEAHQPSFIFNVRIEDVCCSGHGSSKKAAKHRAAEGACWRSCRASTRSSLPACTTAAVKAESNGVLVEPSDHPNSIGILQRGWRLPEYMVLLEAGPPHRREFTVTCRMESLSETASGNSKKSGKKAAANKMIAKLQSLSSCGEITWNPMHSFRLEDLRTSMADKISMLRRSPLSSPNTDYIQMMSELAMEQGFDMATVPLTVCYGTGIGYNNAQNAAAQGALHYVKVMAS
ncbi:hypothetical protein CRUP_035993, partial [Coryphaenoides rupestris]